MCKTKLDKKWPNLQTNWNEKKKTIVVKSGMDIDETKEPNIVKSSMDIDKNTLPLSFSNTKNSILVNTILVIDENTTNNQTITEINDDKKTITEINNELDNKTEIENTKNKRKLEIGNDKGLPTKKQKTNKLYS